MNTINKLIYLVAIAIFMNSCEDPLELLPTQGKVKEEYWKVKEDVTSVLMAAYKELASMNQELFYYGELRGDMLEASNNVFGSERSIMNSNIFPSNSLARWQKFYAVINYCNLVLKYSPQVKELDPTFSEFDYNSLRAEAVFLRSLSYFYLVRIFKDVPFVLTPYDTDNQKIFLPKTMDDIILDSLEIQLNRVTSDIPLERESIELSKGRATRGACNALLADIALWKFEYEDCIEYTNKIIESDIYELVSGAKWFAMFSDGNSLESIFELQFNSKSQFNYIFDLTQEQNNMYKANVKAFDLFYKGTDQEVIRGPGTVKEENNLIWKYIGYNPDGISVRSEQDKYSSNLIIYRLSDVLLMKAEALSQLSRFEEAKQIIDQIRIRAFLSPSNPQNSTIAFEDLIMEERAKEFAYEGKRWFDLLRMGRRNNYSRKNDLISIIVENVVPSQKRVLISKLSDPFGWYMPIHSVEMENNPQLTQNPYYQIYE